VATPGALNAFAATGENPINYIRINGRHSRRVSSRRATACFERQPASGFSRIVASVGDGAMPLTQPERTGRV